MKYSFHELETEKSKRSIRISGFVLIILLLLAVGWRVGNPMYFGFVERNFATEIIQQQAFNGERALMDISRQVSLGPRTPGSIAHDQVAAWIESQLIEANWQTEIQEISYQSHPIRNVVAHWGQGRPWIILGTHYDSRFISNRDPDPFLRNQPVPGANDGASGVAVLLEIARKLPTRMGYQSGTEYSGQVWLVFFDAEDQGGVHGWDWILGSRAFVESLESYPDKVVIVDMIGDTDLDIYYELNSDVSLAEEIWAEALASGYKSFIPEPKHKLLDDHIPFIEIGIPAILLIDFDYPYWHTTHDLPDKVSAESLFQVGETLLSWLTDCPSR